MTTMEGAILGFVKEAASNRTAAEERLHQAIRAARSSGITVPAIAEAAGLSPTRVHDIAKESRLTMGPELTVEQIATLLKETPDVVIVAAGWVGYPEYRKYAAYVCQPGRGFNGDPRRMGFYFHRAVMPEVPSILHVRDHVEFTAENAAALRSSGNEYDKEIAMVIEQMLADHARKVGGTYKVFLLSPPDDGDATLVLGGPIPHVGSGAYVRKHRYVSEAALLDNPGSTGDL